MLKSILTPALIALSLAGAAHAAQPSSDAQLAASAGVAAGQYSAAELQAIIDARLANDQARLTYLLSGTNRAEGGAGDSSGQLAALAGVQPGAYSASELQMILDARTNNDRESAAFVISGTNRAPAAAAEAVTPGEAQLAAALGLDPAQYTLTQLNQLTADAND